MEDKKSDANTPQPETAEKPKTPAKKKNNFKWILLLVFAALIAKVLLAPKDQEVAWLDYESGVKLAAKEDKPILIAFYKANNRFCTDMWNNTYVHAPSIQFIEQNFVPIFVNADKDPALAKEYDVSYYPTHFIKPPDNSRIIKTRRGYDTPGQFRPFLLEGLEKMNREPKN